MVAEFFGFLIELVAELGSKSKKKKVKEVSSQVKCPICKETNLTIHYYCPKCETHVMFERDVIDKPGKINNKTCQSCGAVQDSSKPDDFCQECGEMLNP